VKWFGSEGATMRSPKNPFGFFKLAPIISGVRRTINHRAGGLLMPVKTRVKMPENTKALSHA